MTDYSDWIGRGHTREDDVSDRLIQQFRATLPEILAEGPVPLGLFWALAPDALPPEALGRDGHARLGQFLPPMPLPRRMWAGGEISILAPFTPGDRVTKVTRLEKIAPKSGSTGPLIFLSVRHDYAVGSRLLMSERQDLVYREDPVPGAAPAPNPDAPDLGPSLVSMDLTADAVRLFRFSALTFNGHRIHYDVEYARQVEGYPGLVVHGPLQALAMMNLAAKHFGAAPRRFTYRGLSPLILGETARIEAYDAAGDLTLRVVKPGGPVTMQGEAWR
jgi:3-methylfumaryl-CoA hydratase